MWCKISAGNNKRWKQQGKTKSFERHHLIRPVNFSLIAFESTHIISALAILAITFVTCSRKTFSNQQFQKLPLFRSEEIHNYVR